MKMNEPTAEGVRPVLGDMNGMPGFFKWKLQEICVVSPLLPHAKNF